MFIAARPRSARFIGADPSDRGPFLLARFLTATYLQAMRTQTVNIDQAKNQLAELIAWAAEGGEILIVDNGKPLARLVPPGEPAAYRAHPPTASEFSSDEDSLAWDANGWENVA